MSKTLPFCAGICMLIISSCTKAPLKDEAINTATAQVAAGHKKDPAGSEGARLVEPSLVPVTIGTSGIYIGQFISSYSGSGVTFGTNLPHPIDDPSGIYDGYPIEGAIGFVNYTLTSYSCTTIINGAYFTIFEPTFPSSGLSVSENTVSSITAYDNNLKAIFEEPYSANVTQETKNAQVASIPNPQITVTVNGPGTWIIVRGLLIRDHESPTMMSIVTDKYVTPPVIPPGTGNWVGAQLVNGYQCEMYAPFNAPPSGPITSVTVNHAGGAAVAVTEFSLSYTGTENEGFHSFGTITITGGTVLNIDSWLYP